MSKKTESKKTYKKVIVTGDIVEIYEFEKAPVGPSEFPEKNDSYDPFDLENIKVEEKKDRVEERRKQTVRDARNAARRLVLANFGTNSKFITLTYKENITDINQTDKDFKRFIQRFNYKFKCKLKYLAVREFQRRGAVHYHMICDWNEELKSEKEIREYEVLLGEKTWGHGFVDIKNLGHVDNVGAYLIKYMTKNVAKEFFKGKKIYLCSKGLEQPKVYNSYNAQLIIDTYGLDKKKKVFTNSYTSEYLGEIVYSEYNLKRK